MSVKSARSATEKAIQPVSSVHKPVTQSPVTWSVIALFSLNIAWTVVWYARVQSHVMFSSARIVRYIQELSWRLQMGEPTTVLEQVIWSVALGALVFIVFSLLTRVLHKSFPYVFAGAFAIGAFPVLALCVPSDFFHPTRIKSNASWLIVETAAMVICGLLYYLRKMPLQPAFGPFLLLLHFGLWSWATGSYVNPFREIKAYALWSLAIWISVAFYIGFPVLGFLTSLVSGFYPGQRWDRRKEP